MLTPASTLLFLPPILGAEPSVSAGVAAGVLGDLAELICRIGDLQARSLAGEGDTAWERGELDGSDPQVLSALIAGRPIELVAIARLEQDSTLLTLHLDLAQTDGSVRWSGRTLLRDGGLIEARLALAANLIEAATGRRKDIRRGRQGGTDVLEAYLHCCEARAAGMDGSRRARLLTGAIALDENYLEAQRLLADAHEADDDPGEALRVLGAMARRAPSYASGRLHHGLALRRGGQHDSALVEVQAALEADPDGMVLFAAGLFAEADGDRETAALLYERALERGCIDASLADRLAALRAKEGRPGQAALLWERARKLDPSRDDLAIDLAWAHQRSGKPEVAEKIFADAGYEAVRRFRFQATKARYCAERGRHKEALQATTRALSLGGHSAEMYNLRGEARMALQDRWGARRDFVSALEHEDDPELALSIRTNLARLARGLRPEEAEARFAGALRLFRQRGADAEAELAAVVDLDPEHWQAILLLGMLHRDGGRWTEAAHSFGEVVRIRGSHPQAQSERALAMLALGRGEDALSLARAACDEAPHDTAILSNMGLVLMELGSYDLAWDIFTEAREQDPQDPVTVRCLKEVERRRRTDPRWGSSWSAGHSVRTLALRGS
jgi:tetratricopeptide (TPR) repeat protein